MRPGATALNSSQKASKPGAALGYQLLRAGWLALIVLAIAGLAITDDYQQRRYRQVSRPAIELGLWIHKRDDLLRLREPLTRSGDLASLHRDDRILSVDGKQAPTRWRDLFVLGRLLSEAPGPVVTVRTRSSDGAIRDHALQRSKLFETEAYGGAGLTRDTLRLELRANLIATALVLLATSILLFLRRPREPVAALLSIAMLLMVAGGSTSPHFFYERTPWLPAFGALRPAVVATGWCLLSLAVFIFPSGRFEPRWTRWAALLVGVQLILSALDAYGLVSLPWTTGSLLVLLGAGVASMIVRYRRLPSGPQRQQIRWVLFGFSAGLVFGVAATVLGIAQFKDMRLAIWASAATFPLAFLSALCLTGGLLISLLRYRLYDADMVISRSAGFAVLTVALAAVWAGAEQALEVIFEGTLGQNAGAATAGIAAALAALLVTPAHHRVMNWTERVFQKRLTSLRRDLPLDVGDLRETATVEQLLTAVLDRIGPGVRATCAAVVLKTGKSFKVSATRDVTARTAAAWLKASSSELAGQDLCRDRDDARFPLRLPLVTTNAGPPATIGWLLLGPRPDGSFYGKDELEALREIADPVARAVQIARLREAREAARTREMEAIRGDLAALRGALAGLKPA